MKTGVILVKRFMLFFLILTLAFVWMAPAYADELSKAKEDKKSIEQEIRDVKKNKKNIENSIKEKQNEKDALLAEQEKTNSELDKLQGEVETLEGVVAALNSDLAEAEKKYTNQKDLLETRIKVMYENSSITYLQTLIESKSIIDFFERLQLITRISENDKQLAQDLDDAKKDVEYKKKLRESEKEKAEKQAESKKEEIKSIKASRQQVDRQIQKDKMTLDDLEKLEDDMTKKSQELAKKIDNLMSKGKYTGGIMKWPCPSSTRITSYYGNRFHPILKKYKLHTGIDIGASRGSSIVAAADGKVIEAGWQNGYGKTVIIDHGGKIATLYAHADKLLVSVGDTVKAGQTIAKVGSTGWSTGPHLHFEVIKNGKTQNPLSYLGKKN